VKKTQTISANTFAETGDGNIDKIAQSTAEESGTFNDMTKKYSDACRPCAPPEAALNVKLRCV